MTVRRTSEHEAILHLRLVAINAAVALLDADPAGLPDALVDARGEVDRAWTRAVKAGVAR